MLDTISEKVIMENLKGAFPPISSFRFQGHFILRLRNLE